jgi:hypothetical protein
MTTVNGLTAERMRQIEAACIVAGAVDLNGDLQLVREDGSSLYAGHVRGAAGVNGTNGLPGPQGLQGIQGPQGVQGPPGQDLTAPAAVAFRAYSAVVQTLTTATWTRVTESVQEYNQGGGYSLTADTFTAPQDGVYSFSGFVAFSGNATGQRYGAFQKDGTRTRGRQNAINLAANVVEIQVSTELFCTTGSIVEFMAYQNSGANLDTFFSAPDVAAVFMGHLIR